MCLFLACGVFVAACRLYPVAASGGYSLTVVHQLLPAVTFPVVQQALNIWASALAAQAQKLHCLCLVAQWQVGYLFPDQDRARVPCTGKQTLNH